MESGEKVVVTSSEKVEKSRAGDIDDDIGHLLLLYDFIVFCIYINLCVGICSPISLMLSLLHLHLSSNPTKSQGPADQSCIDDGWLLLCCVGQLQDL